jgi:hemerythrin-like metal-binding protein
MPLIAWDETMSVGIRDLDEDHQKLVKALNRFFDGFSAGQDRKSLDRLLDALLEDTQEHFLREEKLFAATSYPDAAAHEKEHNDLLASGAKVRDALRDNYDATISLELANFLKDWLLHHIEDADKKYGVYMKACDEQ